MGDTIFDKIVKGTIPCYKVWESKSHLAFLTPFANTPGVTVLIPKTNIGDNFTNVSDLQFTNLMLAAKKVSILLQKALNVNRVALVIEGTGVPYLHIKLYPLYGKNLENIAKLNSSNNQFTKTYKGYITTLEGPKMEDKNLKLIQQKIINVC